MYSRHAIELYGELLKQAEVTTRDAFEKEALFGFNGVMRNATGAAGNIARRAALTGESVGARAGRVDQVKQLLANKRLARQMVGTFDGAGHLTGAGKNPGGLSGLPRSQAKDVASLMQQRQAKLPQIKAQHLKWQEAARGGAGAGAAAGAGSTGAAAGGVRPSTVAMLGLGAGAGGVGAFQAGKHVQAGQDKTQRNLAFGAGAAAGLAAPSLLRGAANSVQNLAMSPASLFPGGGGGY